MLNQERLEHMAQCILVRNGEPHTPTIEDFELLSRFLYVNELLQIWDKIKDKTAVTKEDIEEVYND